MWIQPAADVHFAQQGSDTANNINIKKPQLLQSNGGCCWTQDKTHTYWVTCCIRDMMYLYIHLFALFEENGAYILGVTKATQLYVHK